MGIILYIVSVFLTLVLYIFGTVYAIIEFAFQEKSFKGWWTKTNKYFMDKAIATDQYGNVWAAPLFNKVMRKKGGYKFGEPDETISSCLGKNQRDKTLSRWGSVLAFMLDFIDENHCIKSIEEDEGVNS